MNKTKRIFLAAALVAAAVSPFLIVAGPHAGAEEESEADVFDHDLTPEGYDLAVRRLDDAIAEEVANTPLKDDLLHLGVDPEVDYIDMGPHEFVRPDMELAEDATEGEEHDAPAIDPLLRQQLAADFAEAHGRDPDEGELAALVAASDQHTAELNERLAARHDDFAALQAAGKLHAARDLGDEVVAELDGTGEASLHDGDDGISAEERSEWYRRMLVTLINREAAGQ